MSRRRRAAVQAQACCARVRGLMISPTHTSGSSPPGLLIATALLSVKPAVVTAVCRSFAVHALLTFIQEQACIPNGAFAVVRPLDHPTMIPSLLMAFARLCP